MIAKLKAATHLFDEKSTELKHRYLLKLSDLKLELNKHLIKYFDVLLFICAYPDNKTILQLAEKELTRILAFLKKQQRRMPEYFTNSGLPFTTSNAAFSHDMLGWLLNNSNYDVRFNSFQDPKLDLNDVLTHTLPNIERTETTRGLQNDGLLEALGVREENRLQFLFNELSKFNDTPYVKDHFYDSLSICIDIIPKKKIFSKGYNQIGLKKIFYHRDILKRFDHEELLKKPIPSAVILTGKFRERLILSIRHSLLLLNRETDPVTYMAEDSLRFFDLERGITVAVYGMIPERQMPLESYVGYTLFKNGIPAAYGGSWIFGNYADFGINIFETYRGGESGYLLCNLLRVYNQVFGINYFEVEPYQFGLDNPEGIASGAYWFYYRYGFRSLEKIQLNIAVLEQAKIKSRKGYKTSKKTLEKLAQSPLALKLGKNIPMKPGYVSETVTKMIAKHHAGVRSNAVKVSLIKFKEKTNIKLNLNKHEAKVAESIALWVEALKIEDKKRLQLMVQMIQVKPKNLYDYQKLLLQFFSN